MAGFEDFLKKLKGQQEDEQPPAVSPAPTEQSGGFDYFLKKSGQTSTPDADNAGGGSGFDYFMSKIGQPASSVPAVEPFQLRMAKAGYAQKQQNPAAQTQPVTQEPKHLGAALKALFGQTGVSAENDAASGSTEQNAQEPFQLRMAKKYASGELQHSEQKTIEQKRQEQQAADEEFRNSVWDFLTAMITNASAGAAGVAAPPVDAAEPLLAMQSAKEKADKAAEAFDKQSFWERQGNELSGVETRAVGNYGQTNMTVAAWVADKLANMYEKAGAWEAANYWRGVANAAAEKQTEAGNIISAGNEKLQKAKDGAKALGRLGLDIETGAIELGADQLANAVLPGSGMASMGVRVFGQAADDARKDGKPLDQQMLAGTKAAAIEILTEKIAGVGGVKGVKPGWIDGAMDKAFDHFVANGGSAILGKVAQAFGSEAAEEMIADVLNPIADKALGLAGSWDEAWDETTFEGVLYDGLLGGLLGMLGGVGEGVKYNRQNVMDQARASAEQSMQRSIEQAQAQTEAQATEAAQEAAGTREAPGDIPAAPPTETAPTGETERLNTATVSEAEAEPHVYEEPAAEQPTRPAPAATEPTAEPAAQPAVFVPKAETRYNPKTKRGKLEMKAARDLRAETSLWNNNEDAAAAVHRVADSMRDKGRGTDVMSVARKAADEMMKKFKSGIESGDRELYNNLRTYLRAQRIEISPELRGDTTDYNEWRKSVFGKLRLAKTGLPIDTVYQELAQTFGQGLFPENVTAHSDMLARILNVLDAAKPAALMMDEAFSPDDYNVLLEATAGSLAKAAAKTVGGEWANYEPGSALGFKSEAAKRYDAIQTEIETAKWDGEDISEEEAAARVDAFYQQYGVYNPSEILSHEEATDGDQYDEQGAETAVEPGDVPAETERAADTGAEQDGAAGVQRVAEPDVSAERDPGDVGTALAPAERDGRPDVGDPAEVSLEEQPGMKRSQTESNTLSGVAGKLGGEQNPLYYMPVTERQTLTEAVNRVTADGVGEMERLAGKEHWTAADVDTAMTLYGKLQADGVRSRDFGAAQSWGKVIQQRGTSTAQALQAFSKWTRSGAGTASQIRQQLDGEVEAYQISDGRRGLSPEQADKISNDVYDFAQTFDSLAEDDAVGLRELIKRMSDYRGTGTFFEKNFMKLLNRQADIDYLREYALRQMQAIASDATDTADIGQKLKTWQVNAQLTRLGTFFRNLGGNAVFGIQDTLTQDGLGIALDRFISRKTGKRTVALDKSWLSSKARKQAMESLRRSVLEIAGDVNMSGDETRYGTNASNRTFKMSGNGFDRFMSRWEQLLGYSLQSSDAFFRGQQEAAAREGLDNIDSGLTEEQKTQIAEGTADYRLFQNKGTAYGLSKGAHDLLNLVGVGGEVDAAHPQRGRQGGFGLGDMANPYPGVPANLGAKVLEYSPANIVKGTAELVKVLKSVEMGTYDPAKQQQAVMDIARGMAGTPIILALAAAFKSGVVKNSDDEDDLDAAAQNRAEGKTGVQINLDAWERGLNGEPTDWKDGDKLMSVGWLEPLNGFMAIASMLAEDDSGDPSLEVYARHYIDGALQSIREIPAMQSISNIYDTLKYSTGETLGDKVKDAAVGFAGDALTGMIPAPVSQTAKTIDPYYRDTSGDSKYEQVWNSIRNAIPGLRETLPVKQDNYGEPKKGPDSAALRALNNLVLPGAVNELHQSEVSAAVSGLYERTGDEKVVPDRKAPGSVRVDGESHRLTAEEKREWQSEYGKAFGDMAGAFLLSADYDGLTDEQKAAVVEEVGALATYRARRDLYKALGADYSNASMKKLADLADADRDDALRYLAAREIVEGALAGENFDALDQFFDDGGLYGQLSDRAKEMLGTVDNLPKLVKMHDEGLDAETALSVVDTMDALEPTGDHRDVTQRQQTEAIIGSDLSEEQKMDAIRVYASESYAKKAEAAVGAGLPLDKWGEIYGKYADIDDLDLTAAQKVDRFTAALDKDKSLTDKQRDVLRDQLKYFTMVPAEAKRYDQLKGAGMDIDTAVKVADEMRGAENQNDAVDRILASGRNEADQWRALKVYTSESYYNKAAEAYRRGIDLPDYVRMFREADIPNDEGERNGKLSQSELWDFYKKDPGNEDFVRIMWMLNGSSTSWDAYKARHGG